jgi:hypothetical protein
MAGGSGKMREGAVLKGRSAEIAELAASMPEKKMGGGVERRLKGRNQGRKFAWLREGRS